MNRERMRSTDREPLPPSHGGAAPSPRLRGEGRGEGASPQAQTQAQTRGEAPSPGSRKRDPTSPRERGEVRRGAAYRPEGSLE